VAVEANSDVVRKIVGSKHNESKTKVSSKETDERMSVRKKDARERNNEEGFTLEEDPKSADGARTSVPEGVGLRDDVRVTIGDRVRFREAEAAYVGQGAS
jgi:hypothetical protein